MELKNILEAILFTSQKPLTVQELKDVLKATAEESEEPGVGAFKRTPLDNIQTALDQLQREHEEAGRSYRLACVAGSWQFASQPEYAPWLRTLLGQKSRPPRLSQPALETLAVIAYRQPATRAEIEQVRGVAVDGVMQTLLERGLIEQTGRAEVVGRPSLYGTTPAFLEYFGLRSLADLPAADELRRITVQKPETLLTVDPGLATAPPAQLTMEQVEGYTDSKSAAAPAVPAAEQAAAPEAASAETPAPVSSDAPAEPAPAVSGEAETVIIPAVPPVPRKRSRKRMTTPVEAPPADPTPPSPPDSTEPQN